MSRPITDEDVKRAIVWANERKESFAVRLLEAMLPPEDKDHIADTCKIVPCIDRTPENKQRLFAVWSDGNNGMFDVIDEVNKILAEKYGGWK